MKDRFEIFFADITECNNIIAETATGNLLLMENAIKLRFGYYVFCEQ